MEYKRFGNTLYVRLDRGEEIIDSMRRLAGAENIRLAEVRGLGAIDDFTVGVYDVGTWKYHPLSFTGQHEITSLFGTINTMDGAFYCHIHMTAGNITGAVVGGHLNRAVISATADQVGILPGVINAMPLNGKSLTVSVQIQTDATYELNGTTTTENIQDVTLYFVDQYTGEIHGQYSSTVPADQQGTGNRWTWELNKDENGNSLGTGTFTLTIDQFDPTKPEAYTYGDALMVQIVTDKKLALSAFADQLMYYDPVSTGFCVISDPNYKPQIFQYNVDNVAELLGVTPQTDEDGNLLDGDTNYSFGSFPSVYMIFGMRVGKSAILF